MTMLLSNKQFGMNIQIIRIARGLSQSKTVEKLNLLGSPLSRNTYSLIELGRGNIYVTDLLALRKVFNVDISEFFKDIGTSRS